MRRRPRDLWVMLAALMLLAGCSNRQFAWTGSNLARSTVDSLIGFPAITVVAGATDVLDAGNQSAHEERVEELNSAYSEFLNARQPYRGASHRRVSPVLTRQRSVPVPPPDFYQALTFSQD